jgi:hypothetical protein
MSNILEFVTLTPNDNFPIPAVTALPSWYKEAKKYQENKTSTFKNCVPFFESMSTGYVFLTPCDIGFYEQRGEPEVQIPDEYKGFVTKRSAIKEFETPKGYHSTHFAWLPQWGVRTPEGYNALYVTPFNSYSLPFINTNGIINNDKVWQPGAVPFFLAKKFTGVLPKGTPYLQVIPIKRENWSHKFTDISNEELEHFKTGSPHITNYYRENIWEMSKYE